MKGANDVDTEAKSVASEFSGCWIRDVQAGIIVGHGDECKDFLWFGRMDGSWGRNSLCHIGGDLNWFSVR